MKVVNKVKFLESYNKTLFQKWNHQLKLYTKAKQYSRLA